MGNNEEKIAQYQARLAEIKHMPEATIERALLMNMIAILNKGAMAAQKLTYAGDGAVIGIEDMEIYNAILNALQNGCDLDAGAPKK